MNDQLIYNEIYNEPKWYRWADALVVLLIGVACGAVFMYGVNFYNVETTTTTEVEYRMETPKLKQDSGTGSVVAPQQTLQFEEV